MQIVISVTDLQRKWIENYGFIPDDLNVKIAEAILNGTALSKVIEDIRAEIQKPLEQERFFDTENAKAQTIALRWCLEIIDKHIKGEQE